MKLRITLIAMAALAGCARTSSSTERQVATAKQLPQADEAEALLHHVLLRAEGLNDQLEKLKNAMLRQKNDCLRDQIAELEGRPVHHSKADPADAARALGDDLNDGLERIAQSTLDTEAFIEMHNRRHPEAPWGDSKDLLKLICGDCAAARALRDKQLREEAAKFALEKTVK